MKNAEQFENAMERLRAASREQGAPDHVETQLRAAFREQHAKRQRSRRSLRRLAFAPWASAAAAGIVIGAVIWRLALPGHVEAPPAIRLHPPSSQLPLVQAPSPQEIARPAQVAATGPRSARPTGPKRPPRVIRTQPDSPEPVAAVTAAQHTEEFFAIPSAPPMTIEDRGEVIRVRLPRQSLRSLGIPINGGRLPDRIPADILVGEDGIPRGIRLVRLNER